MKDVTKAFGIQWLIAGGKFEQGQHVVFTAEPKLMSVTYYQHSDSYLWGSLNHIVPTSQDMHVVFEGAPEFKMSLGSSYEDIIMGTDLGLKWLS